MYVRVLKELQFAEWAEDAEISDASLCKAAAEVEAGLIDARLAAS